MTVLVLSFRNVPALVDRETSKTTYQIVDELRGSFRAFFYRAIAKLFKYDLKAEYAPHGKDREIENFVRIIEKEYAYSKLK